jgi:hypothetical protein
VAASQALLQLLAAVHFEAVVVLLQLLQGQVVLGQQGVEGQQAQLLAVAV